MVYHDQAILIAVGLSGRGVILGYRGMGCPVACMPLDGVRIDYTEEVFPALGFPDKPGLYVWRGSIGIDGEPIDGPHVDMRGEFERASSDVIVALMGAAEPAFNGYSLEDDR